MKYLITIEAATTTISPAGTPVDTWAPLAELRAERLQQSTEEFLKAQGATGETVLVFRTRYVAGVTLAHRVMFRGDPHNIREVAPIEGDRGLELRCTRLEGGT